MTPQRAPRYTFTEISRKIDEGLQQLFELDKFLLENKVHERSIGHKLAMYLQAKFDDYDVDIEYNKHGIDIKKLPRNYATYHEDKVYPDIIVHRRGKIKCNLLVIELKATPKTDDCDAKKLELFTKNYGEYEYKYGLFIGFNIMEPPTMHWYKNGVKIHFRKLSHRISTNQSS